MPPKAKFTKEQIIQVALDIVREEGIEAVTARSLAKRLGASACPIFTVFENMEEVLTETRKAARRLYDTYVDRGLNQTEIPAFKGVGTQYILFSIREPKLFQMLCIQPQEFEINNILPAIEDHYDEIMSSIQTTHKLSAAGAEKLYKHMWIYTHGIASLCATRTCKFSPQEISEMLTEVCSAVIKQLKENNL